MLNINLKYTFLYDSSVLLITYTYSIKNETAHNVHTVNVHVWGLVRTLPYVACFYFNSIVGVCSVSWERRTYITLHGVHICAVWCNLCTFPCSSHPFIHNKPNVIRRIKNYLTQICWGFKYMCLVQV
jgi:hypothetical protein